MEGNKQLNIDWSKFKSNAKGSNLEKAKDGYVEFCKMLDGTDFELVSDYVGALEKVKLIYIKNKQIKLNISPDGFKRQTYKSIINFKEQLIKNSDEFIKFTGLSEGGNLISQFKSFDGGIIEIDIAAYSKWDRGRQYIYNKLKEINGYTDDCYMDNSTKINIYIDSINLNPASPNKFKKTYKTIANFKNNLKKNSDNFVQFIKLTNGGNLVAKIKTFDCGEVEIDIGVYSKFAKARQKTCSYCKEKSYKILSPYLGNTDKILVDFNCGHKPNWITPRNLKQSQSCPICSESKGERTIRSYLEKNNINFEQEYRFEYCKHKRGLPFDFYISNYNLCIEYDGEQHYKPKDFFGGEESFKITQKIDKIKNKFCINNNINLLRIPYHELGNIEEILDKEFGRLGNL
ncbi:hypothetical protein [Clostridium perfringens]|uniref:hypothetical protein n=1 Tax=Clostridium perfringens TaxID=1502 RepID=UPI00096A7C1C|nr:hypothetical protein [Clostridium perfringens]